MSNQNIKKQYNGVCIGGTKDGERLKHGKETYKNPLLHPVIGNVSDLKYKAPERSPEPEVYHYHELDFGSHIFGLWLCGTMTLVEAMAILHKSYKGQSKIIH